ncbi:hypothetical protein [Nocardioides ungokensis]|uniref:hypothetical protein n=1 Tax=Nocardioides ungokensis TaxID=1643322 RepID=UPI001C60D0CB|nr:hypothetical protein [Nocardioides ungokensis]
MTMTEPRKTSSTDTDVVEMSWDPVTRIVGSLGIYASIDFKQKEVRECTARRRSSAATPLHAGQGPA